MDILDVLEFGLYPGAVVGFAFGLGVACFSWMVRQVWGTFRKITLTA